MRIDRANRRNINESSDLPDVSAGPQMFFQFMKVHLIHKEQVDGYTDESEKTCIVTQGCRQPFTPQQLAMKPEGERSWKWSKLYCGSDLCVKTDDLVKIRNVRYRVMAITDWAEYGYIEYEVIEDYRHE